MLLTLIFFILCSGFLFLLVDIKRCHRIIWVLFFFSKVSSLILPFPHPLNANDGIKNISTMKKYFLLAKNFLPHALVKRKYFAFSHICGYKNKVRSFVKQKMKLTLKCPDLCQEKLFFVNWPSLSWWFCERLKAFFPFFSFFAPALSRLFLLLHWRHKNYKWVVRTVEFL